MDHQRVLEVTRAHYDSHSNATTYWKEAVQKRGKGRAFPLKQFHNTIKRHLINRFAYGAETLLDLACGRGGDLDKWFDAQVKYVKGVDLSPKEVEEARHRYEGKKSRRGSNMRAEFVDTDKLGIEPFVEPMQYDVVTCMFAIHYFFASRNVAKMFFDTVSRNLRDGGFFFGTCPDGKRILSLLNRSKKWANDDCTICALWQGGYDCFGSAFSMAIADTVTEGHEQDGAKTLGSYEYLVFRSTMEGVAREFNLFPVTDYEADYIDGLFDEEDKNSLFKHFRANYPNSTKELEQTSNAYIAFCFQKRENPDGTPRPLPPLPPPQLQEWQQSATRGKRRAEASGSARAQDDESRRHSAPRY
uniref:mRNA (guanine-N(7))-methyltransferase n=1 Tax=Tetraselmis sp. GSL018 TaxID=582737 RepID=A0A061R2I6_9CHLO|mmetsp:Transcript_25650/g.61077  ORF Transcript_25650/g.61077 Transcript_25650/m.61077 type:complete len:358 (+) Transcript_25650:275-1348(+)